MNVNLNTLMLDTEGKPIPVNAAEPEGEMATLGRTVMGALLQQLPTDAQTKDLGYKVFKLADRCKRFGTVTLEAADIELIKRRIEQVYPPWIVGQSWDLLEAPTSPDADAQS